MKELDTYYEITPEIKELAQKVQTADAINPELYAKYDVKRGLRDLNGKGVLAGLTNVSNVMAKKIVDGEEVPDYGRLYYRGYDVKRLIAEISKADRFGFEEIAYLLLFGDLPTKDELSEFYEQLSFYRSLPKNFTRDVILKAPSKDMMNTLQRSVLTLYAYDEKADDISLPNVLRQSMQLISLFPRLAIYGYNAYDHYINNNSLVINNPLWEGNTAENILHLLRGENQYTDLEAKVLDAILILQMDHGGGNNSAFTTHVVTSTNTDTYSSVAAALASLKGPRHGGANIKNCQMFDDIKANVSDWKDDEEVGAYIHKILDKEAFDKTGLLYGVGHAVYSKSDPRAELIEGFVEALAKEKGHTEEFELYKKVAVLAPEIISAKRKMYKGVCINVDYYSGFVYRMLGIPVELYTPLFAIARIVGWSAHRMEELANNSKIIRPAFKGICETREYVELDKR